MLPILFQTITEGSVPTSHGIGTLTDCLKCEVYEERNGAYELALEYPAQGIHAEEIQTERFILAKPNYTDDPQLFRIYDVGKIIDGRFTVNAQHISYDLSGKVATVGGSNTCAGACSVLTSYAGNFTITTDKSASGTFRISAPSSVRSWFAGKAGSLVDIFGGEWAYNNYTATLKNHRGTNRGVQIRYGKNLTAFEQQITTANLCTGIVPFYIDENGSVTTGAKVSTGLTLDTPRDKAVDFSQDVNPDSATPILTQLANLAARDIANHNYTNPLNSITLDFVQLEGLQERVDLCDTVSIFYEPLGITATAKCIKTTWDVLEDRYTQTSFGDARANIADTIVNATRELEEIPTRSFMEESVKRATDAITGNLGGYVVIHDSDGDGEPDEILIMNTPDIATATKVWRWNKSGLGYSSTGYAGPYGTAITADGEIVASFITTGILNADLIKAGVIEDTAHNSSINMTTGVATLKDLVAKHQFQHVDNNGVIRTIVTYNVSDGTSLIFRDTAQNDIVQLYAAPSDGGHLKLRNENAVDIVQAFRRADGYGGTVAVYDASGNERGGVTSSNTGGFIWVEDNNGKTVGELYVRGDGLGGLMRANDASGNEAATVTVNADGGNIYIKNSSDKKTVDVSNYNGAGYIAVNDATGTANAELWEDGGGHLRLKTAAHVQIIDAFPNSAGGGSIQVRNSYGSAVASLFAGTYNDGSLNLYDLNGVNNINLAGASGVVTCVSVNQTSSRKVKENIKPMKDAKKILQLEAVSFDFKEKAKGTNKRGFIAEDVAAILPNLVTPETEDRPAALDYIGMIPYLQQIIKEQDARIKALEEKIKTLEV